MYHKLVRNVLFPLSDLISGTSVTSKLRAVEQSQWLSRDELIHQRNEKLRALVLHAYKHVPFYRERFSQIGLHPGDINSTEDLRYIPILQRQDVKRGFPDDLLTAGSEPKGLLLLRSSGSTGSPVQVYSDKVADSWDWACKFRGWTWSGYEIGDPFVRLWGNLEVIGRSRGKLEQLRWLALRQLFLPAFELDETAAREYVRRINRFRPVILRGYTSAVVVLARVLAESGGLDHRLKGVIVSGEKCFDSDRTLIEEQFGCPVFDDYGGIEVRSIGHECEAHVGLHISAENVIVEFVENRGDPVPAGELGDIVVTVLNRFSMPLIRYRIGDVGRALSGSCPCGRALPLMDHVEGRIPDMIYTPSGKHTSMHFFTILFEFTDGVDQFQVVKQGKDKLVIRIVPNPKFSEEEKNHILMRTQDYVGPEMQCIVEEVEQIPHSPSGKRQFVLQEVS